MTLTGLTTLEKLFLALADKTRLRLLALMAGGEVSVGYLADQLGESQPKISRHLAYLRSAGLASNRRDGKWIYYGIEKQSDKKAEAILRTVLSAILAEDVQTMLVASGGSAAEGPLEPDTDVRANRNHQNSTELEIHLL